MFNFLASIGFAHLFLTLWDMSFYSKDSWVCVKQKKLKL